MKKATATQMFECLSSGIRLDAYRLLVKAGPKGLVAGEIAEALELPPSNLSFHLRAMTHAGLVDMEQEGRYVRYRADLSLMADLVEYLTAECCSGHPELCAKPPVISRRGSKLPSKPATRRKSAQ